MHTDVIELALNLYLKLHKLDPLSALTQQAFKLYDTLWRAKHTTPDVTPQNPHETWNHVFKIFQLKIYVKIS